MTTDAAAWRSLREDWAELRTRWGALSVDERAASLASVEERLFALEGAGGAVWGGASSAAHARAVARQWHGRLDRSARGQAADELAAVMLEEDRRWLARRRGAPRDDVEGAFAALLEVEEYALTIAGGDGRRGEQHPLASEVAAAREELRRRLGEDAAEGRMSEACRSRCAGRMVDHADDAVLLAGERSPEVCARRLELSLDAVRWHLEALEPDRGAARARLERRRRRVERELNEQQLQARLEDRFGRSRVAAWERAVVAAILLVLLMLGAELLGAMGLAALDLSGPLALAVDTGVCLFLLTDFAVKLALVPRRRLWLRRHLWTDLLPSLPFGLLAGLDGLVAETGQASRALRLLRLARLGAYLRALRPLVWTVRALGFLLRGLDRVVRRHARALEREVILFPTPGERREPWRRDVEVQRGMAGLRRSVDAWYLEAHEAAEDRERDALEAARHGTLAAALARTSGIPGARPGRRRDRLPLADDLLRDLATVSGEELEEELGAGSVERLGRAARLVGSSPLRWLPGLGAWAAPDALGTPPSEHVARCVHRISAALHRLLGRVLWWADLHGTLTPGEVVGRIGAALVARTSRPAVRLLLFGALYLAVELAFAALDARGDAELRGYAVIRWIRGVVGQAFVLLGGVCLVLLALGVWLQRLARDTTTFHERVARAQFLHLTDSLKARFHADDAALLDARVFGPERVLAGAAVDEVEGEVEADGARFLQGLEELASRGASPRSEGAGFDPVARTVLLYRDQLDGALLAHTDTRATSQLLGNLALTRLTRSSGRISQARWRWMQSLDLERRRTFLRGPFLWFHSISRALESRAARLIVDYNANAIPLAELERTTPEERAAYEAWLAGEGREGRGADRRPVELTTAFTVLHFLDAHPDRDEEVRRRFGHEVAARMRRDRRALIRTVFGTYPLHRLPLESRVLNLRTLYEDWLQGGRVLLMPLRIGWHVARLGLLGARRLVRAVGAIREPGVALRGGGQLEAGFDVAVRKIHRMRGPAALAALELRATLDPEYHGVRLSGGAAGEGVSRPPERAARGGRGHASTALVDARFLGADPATERGLRGLQRRAVRDTARLERALVGELGRRLEQRLGVEPCADPELARALHLQVCGDVDGVRADLFGEELLVEGALDALEHGAPDAGARPRLALRVRFHRWWRRGGGDRLVEAAARAGVLEGEPGSKGADPRLHARLRRRRLRRAAWRVLAADVDGARRILGRALDADPERRTEAALDRLADALRHPSRVTEQLITLRAAQTLTLLDVRNYRQQVWQVGEYGADGDAPPPPLPGLRADPAANALSS